MSSRTSDASSLKASAMRAVQKSRALCNDVTVAVDGAGPLDGAEIPKSACDPNMALESNMALEAKNMAANEMFTLAAANGVMRTDLAAFEVRGSLLGLGRDIPSSHMSVSGGIHIPANLNLFEKKYSEKTKNFGLYETSTCPHGLR